MGGRGARGWNVDDCGRHIECVERVYVVSMRVCVYRRTELRSVPIERTIKVRLDIVRVGDEGL